MNTVVWLAVVAAISGGCSTSPNVSGTLVYSEQDTQHIRVLDLSTGETELIDSGQFGSVSIAPDGTHVAYAGLDGTVKVADLTGTISPLPGGGCATTGNWVSNSVLTYCVSGGTMLLPSIDGGQPRLLDSHGLAVTPDGGVVSYVNGRGEVILENGDGSEHRILRPSTNPTAATPSIYVAGLTADQEGVLVSDFGSFPSSLHIVAFADGSSVDVDDAFFMGTPVGAPRFLGASAFSADHSELLLQSTTDLMAVTLTTGAKRTIATLGDQVSAGGAVFLDDEHVLWVRVEDHSEGDLGRFSLSLHVAGPTATDDLVLDDPNINNQLWPTIAVSSEGFIAVPSDVLLIKFDGTVLLRNESTTGAVFADDILGLTPEGDGVITTALQHDVRYISSDGTNRQLVTTGVGPGLLAPVAAYAGTQTP